MVNFNQFIHFLYILIFFISVSISWDDVEEVPQESNYYYELKLSLIHDIHFVNSESKFESFINQINDVSYTFNEI